MARPLGVARRLACGRGHIRPGKRHVRPGTLRRRAARESSQAARDATDALAASLKPQVHLVVNQYGGQGDPFVARAAVVGPLSPAGLAGVLPATDVLLQINLASGKQNSASIPTLDPNGSRWAMRDPHHALASVTEQDSGRAESGLAFGSPSSSMSRNVNTRRSSHGTQAAWSTQSTNPVGVASRVPT